MPGLEFIYARFIFCHRLIVFHLPLLASRASGASQRQMKRKVLSASNGFSIKEQPLRNGA
jgi:hypothetical protein